MEDNYKLNLVERLIVNSCTLLDILIELSRLTPFNDSRSAFENYYQKFDAKTLYQKTRVIWYAKIDKTIKIIRSKYKNEGVIPERIESVCRKNSCGCIRLWVADRYN